MMSHLSEQARCRIENLLNAGVSPLAIARKENRAHSTIVREVRNHRKENELDRRRKKNFCSRRKNCRKTDLCKVRPGNCPGCCSQCKMFECGKMCPEYHEDSCPKLERSPFVCNGCRDLSRCQKRKYFYTAASAQREYREVLHDCRKGIDVSTSEIRQYNELIQSGVRNGQSLHHIMEAHKDVFQKCEKTIYNYFNRELFSLARGEMPRICMRKPRTVEKIRHKIDPKYRNGRQLEDYKRYVDAHPEFATVQMDSVIGKAGGKVLLTLQFECGMMLACLRDTNNSQSVIDYFDMLERKFGLDRFRSMFPVILTDNGSEFSNPAAIEICPVSGEPRTKVFFCDPNASWQKASIENNHTNLRRILFKGASFDQLVQNDVDIILSHLNSYLREKYDNMPAASRFCSIFGKDCMELLNLTLIPADKVILDPKLVKGKI